MKIKVSCIEICAAYVIFFFISFIRGPVLSLSVHPSGKLALTVGQDKTLRTWNLITGKSAYISNIKRGNRTKKNVEQGILSSSCGFSAGSFIDTVYFQLFQTVAMKMG
jgi:WD40 repeat protein